MSHPDAHKPVAYEAMEGPRTIEILLNDRDVAAPRNIWTTDGRQMRRIGGRVDALRDWVPVPGETRVFLDATDDWAAEHAAAIADLFWNGGGDTGRVMRGAHTSQEDLEAVLLQGFLQEVRHGAGMITIMPSTEPPQEASSQVTPASTANDVGF